MHHHHAAHGGPHLTRRAALGGLGAALAFAGFRPAFASVPFPQRLVIVNMRGGLDGLAAVIPYGDPALAGLRAPLLPPGVGKTGGMFDLGGYFGLHPAMTTMNALYQGGQMLAVHAVGGIQQTRSHFADQGVLQAGDIEQSSDGWLNRLAGVLPTVAGGVEAGMVVGSAAMPLICRGSTPIGSWMHCPFKNTQTTLAALVETLGAPDPLVGLPMETGFNERTSLQAWLGSAVGKPATSLQSAMQAAGVFLAAPGGPAVALVETSSMDTHSSQVSRLQVLLADLDASIGLLAANAGAAWANTVVMTITEFGRTAYMNGSTGTDHGTAFAMFLAGGAVSGGKVVATWPGLSQLYQNRDLAPTVDVRSVIMGVLQGHLGLSAASLATVFPNAASISPMTGLVT